MGLWSQCSDPMYQCHPPLSCRCSLLLGRRLDIDVFLQAEMMGSPATAAILEALHATRATAKERHAEMERKIRQVCLTPCFEEHLQARSTSVRVAAAPQEVQRLCFTIS